MAGKLYLVSTPIGNLDDISARALDTLRMVDVVACEDTRHTRKLLNRYSIDTRTISYHQHNEVERSDELVERLIGGESIAVVSDAGTPAVSDPGTTFVRAAIAAGIDVVPIPGPAAFVSALVASGLNVQPFLFDGFLPRKQGERRRRLEELADLRATLVFYEAPHRLVKMLDDCCEILGDRPAAVARELTKIHEEIIRGSLSEVRTMVAGRETLGECVVVVEHVEHAAAEPSAQIPLANRVDELEKTGLDPRAALKAAAKEYGISRSEAYRRMHRQN